MDIYAQNIMDHYKNPRNWGVVPDADITHSEANISCGDNINIGLKLNNETISDLKFQGEGCAISLASASIIGEKLIGKTMREVLELNEGDMQKFLGVPISSRRQKCALMGLLAIQNALLRYSKKPVRQFSDVIKL